MKKQEGFTENKKHIMYTEAQKVSAAIDVVGNSIFHGWTDLSFVKKVLPIHYEVNENKEQNSIHCMSKIGIRNRVGAEDNEHWEYIMQAFRKHFNERLSEVFHNVCFCHTDFTIYMNENNTP